MEYNIVLVGPSYAGKTAILMSLLRNVFSEEYQPTLEDTYRKQMVVAGESHLLHIMDISGMEEYSSLLDSQICKADGILCVFSVDNMDSFDSITSYLDKVRLISHAPTILVGNKCDKSEEDRKVNNCLGEACAEQYGIPFFTTSAKTGERIFYCFQKLIQYIRDSKMIKIKQDPENTLLRKPELLHNN